MKIAFIGQKGIPVKSGGVDRHVESLAEFLVKNGQTVIVYNRRGYTSEKISNWQGIEVVELPLIDTKNLAAITHCFLATISAIRAKVDVIHYHGIGPALLTWIPRWFAPRIRVITTLHSFDYGNDKWGAFARFMLKLGERIMVKNSHQVIVLTPVMQDYLRQRYNYESVIIPNGALVKQSLGSDKLKAFGLEPGRYILSLSRLIRLKGIQYLIPAFKALNEPGLKLAIVGDGEYRKELEQLAGSDPNIVFCGNQSGETLNQLYSQAKLFVQSSEMEGLSISLLEAMAHGLPIIASDIIANKEAAGDVVTYFESMNSKDLEEKMTQLLADENQLKELAKLAKERAETVYDWQAIAQKTILLYNK